jgi:hypothetical protein
VARALLPGAEGFNQQGGRAADEQAHGLARPARQAGQAQQPRVQRGHAHEHGGTGQAVDDGLRIKLIQPQHGAAIEQSAMNGDKQAVDVKNGQGVNEHVAPLLGRAPAPVGLQHLGIRAQVAVGEHGPFAASRRAAGVQNGGQVVCGACHRLVFATEVSTALQQRAGLVIAQGEYVRCTSLEGQGADPTEVGGGTHHHGGFGVANKVADFARLISGVER